MCGRGWTRTLSVPANLQAEGRRFETCTAHHVPRVVSCTSRGSPHPGGAGSVGSEASGCASVSPRTDDCLSEAL
jgi:hypothetical protein